MFYELPWNNDSIIEKMDGCNPCRQITSSLSIYTCLKTKWYHRVNGCNWNEELTQCLLKKGWLQVLISMKHNTLEKTRSLQATFLYIDGTMQVLLWNSNTPSIEMYVKYTVHAQCMAARAEINTVPIKDTMKAYFRYRHTLF